jgi:hypothetical protein
MHTIDHTYLIQIINTHTHIYNISHAYRSSASVPPQARVDGVDVVVVAVAAAP